MPHTHKRDTTFTMLIQKEECKSSSNRLVAIPQKRKIILFQPNALSTTARMVFISHWICLCMAYSFALAASTIPKEAVIGFFATASVLAVCGYAIVLYLKTRSYRKNEQIQELARLERINTFATCAEAITVIGLSAASIGFLISGISAPRYFSVIGCFASMCAILSRVASMTADHKQLQLVGQYMDKEEYDSRVKTVRNAKVLGCLAIALGAVSICMNIASISSSSVHTGGLAWNMAKTIASCGWLTTCVGSFVLIRMSQRNRCYNRLLSECEVSAVTETLAQDRQKSVKNALIALGNSTR
ncbi:hypothetical protein F0Q53_04690 [Anaplasma marginale]|uniref:Uncharacterized protein n=3 Tax=Anaplasma marginale TaxID=770 RepID=A0A643CMJ8_ANAMA|nr:hypothetical protein F0Q53_04690 [Anaplasma marginale]KAB0450919.1 hypothetical protein FY207_04780 [Anaplasma marginale]